MLSGLEPKKCELCSRASVSIRDQKYEIASNLCARSFHFFGNPVAWKMEDGEPSVEAQVNGYAGEV